MYGEETITMTMKMSSENIIIFNYSVFYVEDPDVWVCRLQLVCGNTCQWIWRADEPTLTQTVLSSARQASPHLYTPYI